MNNRNHSSDFEWDKSYLAPAKLNLFLHVIGRRDDGYHLLQSVFRFIDLADTLRFSPRSDDKIRLQTPLQGVPPEDDLSVRAAYLLQKTTGCKKGVDIYLEKNIPMGGGLGGGSSDAATVLMVLSQLWESHLTRTELEKLGLTLGADVPVFVHGKNAFAEGVGEIFTPVTLPEKHYLIVYPNVLVSTAAVFSDPALCRNTPPMRPEDWREGMGHNDLEAIACRHHPAVDEARRWLRERAPAAMMTGSGASLFAAFDNRAAALKICDDIPKKWQGIVARGISAHPLA